MAKRFLTKDNFWNLMFWVLMVVAGLILDNIPDTALFLGLPLLIIFPTIVIKIINQRIGVSLNNDNIFINSKGEPLNKRYPRKLGLILVFSFFACIPLLHKATKILHDSLAVYIGIILFFPTLYFIYKNCPITILFSGKAWVPDVVGFEIRTTNNPYDYNGFKHRSDEDFRRTSPSYSYLHSNIHHHRR